MQIRCPHTHKNKKSRKPVKDHFRGKGKNKEEQEAQYTKH